MKKLSFLAACREFFGTKEGQTALEFAKEVRQLNDADRVEIAAGLLQHGIEVTAAP